MSSKVQIFISLNTPSSKNSRVWTGKFFVSSKTVQRWIKATEKEWKDNRKSFLNLIKNKNKPYKIGLYFIRDSKRRFDYNNVSQIVFDLMQKYEWIDDDSAYDITPVYLGFEVDKDKAGVYISVL